ncbi:MAG: MmgE/PrpD family protein [Candidatus Bathyarchaeia archaeon]
MGKSLTSEVIEFLLRDKPPPAAVRREAIMHVIDGLGLMLAGSRTECVNKLASFIREEGSKGQSTIIGLDLKANPSNAALVNGVSGHVDDYDDTQLSSSPDRVYGLLTHPTTPVLAAALAVAESTASSGRAFLDAFIAGFEVECKLAESINPEHYKRGFHSTGTLGAFGACAASALLFKLDEDALRHALGITASMSSGIRVNFGTMTKALHAGRAASNGVIACLLAKKGFTADRESLDGRWGFMSVLGGGCDPEKMLGKMGNPYSLLDPGASIKMYPCGSLAQPSMDMLLEIVLEEGLHPEDVREVRLRAGPNILEPLRYDRPQNELQAKFSLQFGLACILVRRRAGLREYTLETLNSLEIRRAMEKIKTILDPEVARMGTDKMRSIVEVELQNGRVLRRLADTARGTPEKPLKESDIEEKFRQCASFVLGDAEIRSVLNLTRDLERVSDIRQLTSLLGKE